MTRNEHETGHYERVDDGYSKSGQLYKWIHATYPDGETKSCILATGLQDVTIFSRMGKLMVTKIETADPICFKEKMTCYTY